MSIGVDGLTGLAAFVRAAETRSFVAAGRLLGVSSSAVGKSVARLEERSGPLPRSTRSISLTPEGALFFERCQRVLADLGDAEAELSHAREAPRGKLASACPPSAIACSCPCCRSSGGAIQRWSSTSITTITSSTSSRRAWTPWCGSDLTDSRLVARRLGSFRFLVVGLLDYLRERGTPRRLDDLARHAAASSTDSRRRGRSSRGDLRAGPETPASLLPVAMTGNSLEALPRPRRPRPRPRVRARPLAVRDELARGALVSVLDPFSTSTGHVSRPLAGEPAPLAEAAGARRLPLRAALQGLKMLGAVPPFVDGRSVDSPRGRAPRGCGGQAGSVARQADVAERIGVGSVVEDLAGDRVEGADPADVGPGLGVWQLALAVLERGRVVGRRDHQRVAVRCRWTCRVPASSASARWPDRSSACPSALRHVQAGAVETCRPEQAPARTSWKLNAFVPAASRPRRPVLSGQVAAYRSSAFTRPGCTCR